MGPKQKLAWMVALTLSAAVCGAQTPAPAPPAATPLALPSLSPDAQPAVAAPAPLTVPGPPKPLFDFRDSDIKFNLQSLMNTLRDQRHEGWVLAAYPDPNTHRPLIGAGFSLDVPARAHPQTDPQNPHPFLEPSSAQLWQAAGLDPTLLQTILGRFNRDASTWTTKQYRRKIRMHALAPELTDEEATQLLRISTIQAVFNARAYCRNFDQLSGPQQMALSQLVFQMGVNLEEFTQFLSAINGEAVQPVALDQSAPATDSGQWKAVQATLMDSQWARRYSGRASTVIAMFDPNYLDDPNGAERRVEAVLHPPKHRRHQQPAHMVRTGSSKRPAGKATAKANPAHKRKAA
ncbi:MAG TPA: hypothetical protein VK670_02365 [Silvibacterium sp.]|nr:hypothetical protein [Silvibacterium sp.]